MVSQPSSVKCAFTDISYVALIEMPTMRRRKFSYKGKPHGRNELISEYLWIAYLQSLKPGERPDQTMRRDRKQVSSHIQVIKALFKGYPGCKFALSFWQTKLVLTGEDAILFPPKADPKNGFEDSFKDNPCLLAISQGRLPNNRYEYQPEQANVTEVVPSNDSPIRPTSFWLLITTQPVPDESDGRFNTEEDLHRAGIVAHKFSGLSQHRGNGTLNSISNWQRKFPTLERLRMKGEVNCEIIHMEVSLNLMTDHPTEGSELCCRTELSIPGRQSNCEWRIVTTFVKPPELYCNSMDDPPMEGVEFQVGSISSNEVETRIKVPFPAKAWANAFTQFINLQKRYEERRRAIALGVVSGPPAKSVREYVDELSMYQEIGSSAGPRAPFIRRAIILWTFHKSRVGEGSVTNWRYIDHLPPRRSCMSPSPHQNHQISAHMNDNYNSWAETPMNNNMMDPFSASPHHDLQTPYIANNYGYSNLPFDMPANNMSFISNKTADSESTLVENDAHIDQYLSNGTAHLGDFDPPTSNWLPPSGTFDADPAWSNYNVPVSAPSAPWDDHKAQVWPAGVADAKSMSWVEESHTRQHWHPEAVPSQPKQTNLAGQTIEQRLAPWIEHHNSRVEKDGFVGVSKEDVVRGQVDTGRDDWNANDDEFDYSALADRLK